MLLLGACQAQASNPLLASELVYESAANGWTRTIVIDPRLSKHPELVREIRKARISNMLAGDDECYTESKTGCEEDATFDLHFDGTRLVSVLESTQVDTGGAHPRGFYRDHLFDMASGQEMRFGDLFNSWAAVRPVLQRELCTAVKAMTENGEKCPDIEKQAFSLQGYRPGQISTILVTTQDYELGFYAAGNGPFPIEITPSILSQVKAEYRSDFENHPSESGSSDASLGNAGQEAASGASQPALLEASAPRGPGNCKIGDPLQFVGGWAVGAGGVSPFENPATNFENFLAQDSEDQTRFAEQDPLKFDVRGGCTGVGHIDPTTMYLSQPLGGGTVKGGKFLVTAVNGTDGFGQRRACQIIVRTADVTCQKTD